MTQDADYVTDPIYPHLANQGIGLDMTPITITPDPNADRAPTSTRPRHPTSPPSNVMTPLENVSWGYDFQVTTTIQNLGPGRLRPVKVDSS